MTLPQGIPPSSKGRRSQTLSADSGAGEAAEGRPCSLGPAREPGCWTTANVAAAGTLGEAHWPGSGFDIPPEAAAPIPAACISLLVLLRQIPQMGRLKRRTFIFPRFRRLEAQDHGLARSVASGDIPAGL